MLKKPAIDDRTGEFLLLLVLTAACIGLYYSNFVLSIFPFLVMALGLLKYGARAGLRHYLCQPAFLCLSMILLVYVLSGINSENTTRWLERVNSNLIFLFIPMGMAFFTPLKERTADRFAAIYVLVNFTVSAVLLVRYAVHFQEFNMLYLSGKTIPTPIIHIRYSYLTAVAAVFSAYLFLRRRQVFIVRDHIFFGFAALFLVVFLHVLAVRTGLLSFYFTLVCFALWLVFRKREWIRGGLLIAGSVLILVAAYHTLPTLRNKAGYMLWDLRTALDQTSEHHNSDRLRINSILFGLQLIKEKPLLGTGIGDLEAAMDEQYAAQYPELPDDQRFVPISQFVLTAAGMGLIGAALFYGLLLLPLILARERHFLLLPFYGLTLVTFFADFTIELQVGKSAFLMVACMLMSVSNDNS